MAAQGASISPVRWVYGSRFQSPGWLFGLFVAGLGASSSIADGFAFYGAQGMWRAFIHPDPISSGSLVWVGVPLFLGLGLSFGLVFASASVRRIGIAQSGVQFEGWGLRSFVTWSRFRRPIISMGRFGASVRFEARASARSVALLLNREQAWELAIAGDYPNWRPVPEAPDSKLERAFEGRFRRLRFRG